MRRFFRSADLAALIAVAIATVPLTNRLAAQDLQPMNSDSVAAVAHDNGAVAAPAATSAATIDFRALQVAGPVAGPVAAPRTSVALSASRMGLRSAAHTREAN